MTREEMKSVVALAYRRYSKLKSEITLREISRGSCTKRDIKKFLSEKIFKNKVRDILNWKWCGVCSHPRGYSVRYKVQFESLGCATVEIDEDLDGNMICRYVDVRAEQRDLVTKEELERRYREIYKTDMGSGVLE